MAIIASADPQDLLTTGHPLMTLLSGSTCVFSHCCRIVLLEKDIEHSIEYISAQDSSSRLGENNPYGETPTLIDRDLTLYETPVIIEYLDERFPHPPLLPVDPVARAKIRLMIAMLTRDWLLPLSKLEERNAMPSAQLKASIRDGLLALSPLFTTQPFFLNREYTMADAYITPLLWRLPALDIKLPKQGKPLQAYAERMFKRAAFRASLSHQETEFH